LWLFVYICLFVLTGNDSSYGMIFLKFNSDKKLM